MEKEINDMVRKMQVAKSKRDYPNGAGPQSLSATIIGRYFSAKKPMTNKQRKSRAKAKRARRGQ